MNKEKVDLLIKNSKELEDVKGQFGQGWLIKCNALTLTLKNQKVDVPRINLAIDLIKANTSIFSNFRGYNILNTAITISLEENMEEALKEILYIYDKLNKEFFSSPYLVLAALVIFGARDRVNVYEAVKSTKAIHSQMKDNHFWLTGSEDISSAAMIATTSTNYKKTMEEMEQCYNLLSDNGFWRNNSLQGLSHILSLFDASVEDKVSKVLLMNNALKNHNVKLKDYSLPVLGLAAFLTDTPVPFAEEVEITSQYLKSHKGYGNLALGSTVRDMIAVTILASDYIDTISTEDQNKFLNTTNNVAITVMIALEMLMVATSAAVAGAYVATT